MDEHGTRKPPQRAVEPWNELATAFTRTVVFGATRSLYKSECNTCGHISISKDARNLASVEAAHQCWSMNLPRG
jgi:hypothetical protein